MMASVVQLSSCDVLQLSNKVDIEIIAQDQAGVPIVNALVIASATSSDRDVGVESPGQIVWYPGGGSKRTDENGRAMFHKVKKGKVHVVMEVAGYNPHWETFLAESGPVFRKVLVLTSR